MSAEALKPCPFCGGSVTLEMAHKSRHEIYGERQWWGVKCRNTINLGGTCAIEQVPSASPEAAIERWNRRSAPAAGTEKDAERYRWIRTEQNADDAWNMIGSGLDGNKLDSAIDAAILAHTKATEEANG